MKAASRPVPAEPQWQATPALAAQQGANHGASNGRIHDSPAMLAQRVHLKASFGPAAQFAAAGEEEMLQAKFDAAAAPGSGGGLPGPLRRGIELMSGMDMSDVRVHSNSPKPAQLGALAYAQGNDIHLAPGQARHLPHEAWHVVQQRHGRVRPTTQAKGVSINDEASLECEADQMGAKATTSPGGSVQLSASHSAQLTSIAGELGTAQLQGRFLIDDGEPVGEGQVGKSEFLGAMQTQVLAVSKEVLGPFGMAQDDCPDLKYWVNHYEGKDAAYVEAVIARYAPASEGASNWNEYLGALVERIRAGLVEHTHTGAEVDPEPIPDSIDKQRPPPSVFGIQKMADPVAQLGCSSSNSSTADDKEPEKPKSPASTGPTSAATTSTTTVKAAMEEKHAERTAGEIRARAVELRRLFEAHQYLEIGRLLRASEPPEFKAYPEAEDYIRSYLNACSSTATAISQYVLGQDLTPKQGSKSNATVLDRGAAPSDGMLGPWKLNDAFKAAMARDAPCYYQMSVTSVSHHFIVIDTGSAYDVYESDANVFGDKTKDEPEGNKIVHFLPAYNASQAQPSQTGTRLSEQGLVDALRAILTRCKVKMDQVGSVALDYRSHSMKDK